MTPRWRLFPKYALLIITLVGSMLVASGAIGLYFSWRETEAHLVALQVEKAQNAATRIEQYILDIEHQISWTALPRAETDGDALEQRRIEYLKLQRQAPAITEVVWIDPKGREQLRISRLTMDAISSGTDLSLEEKFRVASKGIIYYGPVYFRKGTEPYMTIARPAMGSGDGVTAAEVNLKFVWDVVSRIKVGSAGLAYVVDADGVLVAHPDISLVLKKSDLKTLPQVAARDRPTDSYSPLGRDLQGNEVFAAHAPIPTLRWTVLVELPRTEAFAPLYATLQRTSFLLVAALLISIAASFFLARTLVRPLRALQEGAAQIGAGDLEHHIEVRTGDELEGLAEQFNRMSARLRESYAGLERKVEQRTAELTEALGYQTATAEILAVISSSPADVTPILEAVAHRSRLLCQAHASRVWLSDGEQLRAVAGQNAEDALSRLTDEVLPLRATSVVGRAFVERCTLHINDIVPLIGSEFVDSRDIHARQGYRTVLGVPMMRAGEPIGVIAVMRQEVQPFSKAEIRLIQTFADQAVIAIQNSRLFNEIQAKSRELELANKHKSEFLANMSHELRTPLNAIIGFSEVLSERMFGDVNDKQYEYLLDIHSSGHHLLTLINDILDLSKIEAGRMELDLASTSLPMLLDNCMTLVRERASRQGLVLALEVEEGVGDWVADVRKLKQVVINLLSNAVKFTPAGGKVTLRARRLKDAVEIAVVDTGVGIAPDQHALVFEEFRQAGGDYLRKSEGTGLGLSLAKRFVELHGGVMRVESEPGHGSTFAFVLPKRVAAAV